MKIIVSLIICLPVMIYGQTEHTGIKFENELTWKQIKAKAKKENKYIFVDCFATWCGPCKVMDREVYPKAQVGNFMNRHFISLKVQMDTTANDNERTKNWHHFSNELKTKYTVTTYPTYLFFSPEGIAVHQFCRAIRDTDFVNVAKNALIPEKQYYALLKQYRSGKKDYSKLPYIANIAKIIGDTKTADSVAVDYIHRHLHKAADTELLNKKNIEFLSSFIHLVKSEYNVFQFIYKYADNISTIIGINNFGRDLVNYIITKEEITPQIWPGNKPTSKEPDWANLTKRIKQKYNADYAERTVLDAKIKWYNEFKDWNNISKYTVEKIDKYGLDTTGLAKYITNNILYEVVFQHSKNIEEINKAIQWMELIVRATENNGDIIDTYANLLYKAGKVKEALIWQEKAARLNPDNNDIQTALEKMKKGEPTWSISP